MTESDRSLARTRDSQRSSRFAPTDVSYLGREPLNEDLHVVANGYANAWHIDPRDVGSSEIEITLFFQPQAY